MNVAIEAMLYNNKNYASHHKTNELISTWKQHLSSWDKFNSVPRLFIKYEDMLDNTKKILLHIINFINSLTNLSIKKNNDFLENILNTTSFNYLQLLEKNIGFNEATNNSLFFRKGISNQWKTVLSQNQKDLMQNELEIPMKQLGYLV